MSICLFKLPNYCDLRSYYVEKKNQASCFLKQLAQRINGEANTSILGKYYLKGQAAPGSKAYPALVRFKMTLLQT